MEAQETPERTRGRCARRGLEEAVVANDVDLSGGLRKAGSHAEGVNGGQEFAAARDVDMMNGGPELAFALGAEVNSGLKNTLLLLTKWMGMDVPAIRRCSRGASFGARR